MSHNVHKLSILQKNKKPDTLISNTFQYTEHFEFSIDNDKIINLTVFTISYYYDTFITFQHCHHY